MRREDVTDYADSFDIISEKDPIDMDSEELFIWLKDCVHANIDTGTDFTDEFDLLKQRIQNDTRKRCEEKWCRVFGVKSLQELQDFIRKMAQELKEIKQMIERKRYI